MIMTTSVVLWAIGQTHYSDPRIVMEIAQEQTEVRMLYIDLFELLNILVDTLLDTNTGLCAMFGGALMCLVDVG